MPWENASKKEGMIFVENADLTKEMDSGTYKRNGNFGNKKMRLRGIEPPHAAPEATALSTELQTHLCNHTLFHMKLQVFYFAGFDRRNGKTGRSCQWIIGKRKK